jgi:hypothetical protein
MALVPRRGWWESKVGEAAVAADQMVLVLGLVGLLLLLWRWRMMERRWESGRSSRSTSAEARRMLEERCWLLLGVGERTV